jgi:fibronectin type 3 domain-containing protein
MTPAEMYGDIYLGSLKNPTFHFTPGTPNDGVASIKVDTQGGGYTVAPLVEVTGPVAGKAATAVATMKLDKITVANPGSGYTAAPLVSFAGGGGSGAVARSYLRTSPATAAWTAQGLYRVSAAGALYNGLMQLNFTPAPAGGVTTTGYATVTAGKITAINVVNPGKGYTAVPLISVVARAVTYTPPPVGAPVGTYGTIATSAVLSGTGGKATVKGVVDAIELYGLDNTTPALTLSTSGGGGYTDLRTLQITLTGGGGTGATATATGRVFDVTLTHPGSGYGSTVPSVTFKQMINGAVVAPLTPAAATAAVASDPNAKSSILVKTKTIQELFDPTYGRLNATLGVELPFTSALTQTTIPLGYVDETTEEFSDGETQIWKITHNGVDSHPVHFHLLNVQVINRVGWDGFIQPIEPREMGWKETVMMSPLEDIIVAVRAKKPTLPGFGVPLNQRLMDPTQPEGSPFGFTQIDPVTGNPKVVTNALVNYGWEYAWHCHILGHEENDFMRPIKFNANEAIPTGPVLNTVTAVGADATLNFTDTSSTEFKFSVLRAPVDINGVVGVYTEVGTDLALSKLDGNFVSSNFVDAGLPLNQYLSYKVAAVGAAGEASSNAVQVSTYVVPAAVSGLAAVASPTAQVTLSWTNDQPVTSYNIVRTGGAGPAVTFTATGAATGYVDTTSVGGQTYTYAVTAVNGDKVAASATSVAVLTPAGLAAPAMVGANVNATRIQISWLDQSATETSFVIERSTDGGAFVAIGNPASTTVAGTGGTKTFANNVGAGVNDVQAGHTYVYRVVAQNATTSSSPSATTTVAFVKPEAPSAPVAGTVTRFLVITDRIVLNWTRPPVVANAPAVTASRIEWSATADFATVVGGLNVNSTATTATATVARGAAATPNPTAYYFRVRSTNAAGDSLFSTVSASVATK